MKSGNKWRLPVHRSKKGTSKWSLALKENKPATRDTSNRIHTVAYNPALPNIHDILRKKQPILQSTERLRNIFKEVPVVAFCHSPSLGYQRFFLACVGELGFVGRNRKPRIKSFWHVGYRSPNLRDLLVCAKLANNDNAPKPPAGTIHCNSRPDCSPAHTLSYTFTNTGETRQIKHHITCDSANLTYMIQCKRCKKQYIGETERTLLERFKEHIDRHQTIHSRQTP